MLGIKNIKKKVNKFPNTPGVYFFVGRNKRILYIGKAGSLKDRVRSYFAKDVFVTRGPGIEQMVNEAKDIDFKKTDSVLEALILEAELIKKHKPKYNVKEKDDKSFNYVVVTDEDFPKVLLMRGHDLEQQNLKPRTHNLKAKFGPFPQGGNLKEALRVVRKIFPFRDKCTPIQHSDILKNVGMSGKGLRACFNRQIGLCPGVCTGEITKKEYQKAIRNIRLLFGDKKSKLIKTLEREMEQVARARKFEKAAKIRNKIFSLKHIQDISLLQDTSDKRQETNFRIEAYDVAHFAGKEMVGVMTVVEDNEAKKSGYRKFKLKTIREQNDPAALREIIERRFKHSEWPHPDLIIVDGGERRYELWKNHSKVWPWRGLSTLSGWLKMSFIAPKGLREIKKLSRSMSGRYCVPTAKLTDLQLHSTEKDFGRDFNDISHDIL